MDAATADIASVGRATERVTVRPFANADAGRWEAFVERCPEATFFHCIEWRDIIEDVFNHRCH